MKSHQLNGCRISRRYLVLGFSRRVGCSAVLRWLNVRCRQIYIYICMYVCMYIYVCVCIYIYVCVYSNDHGLVSKGF